MSLDFSVESVRAAVFTTAALAYTKGNARLKQTIGAGVIVGSTFHIRCANVQIAESNLEEQEGILHDAQNMMLTTRADGLVTSGDDEFFLYQY